MVTGKKKSLKAKKHLISTFDFYDCYIETSAESSGRLFFDVMRLFCSLIALCYEVLLRERFEIVVGFHSKAMFKNVHRKISMIRFCFQWS